MFTVTVAKSTELPEKYDIGGRKPIGVQAILVAVGVVIHPGLAERLPRTSLTPLTSVGDRHTYMVSLRGYTVEKFIEVVTAFANNDSATGERLIGEI